MTVKSTKIPPGSYHRPTGTTHIHLTSRPLPRALPERIGSHRASPGTHNLSHGHPSYDPISTQNHDNKYQARPRRRNHDKLKPRRHTVKLISTHLSSKRQPVPKRPKQTSTTHTQLSNHKGYAMQPVTTKQTLPDHSQYQHGSSRQQIRGPASVRLSRLSRANSRLH